MMIGGSITSLKIMIITAVLVFLLTAQEFNINGLPFVLIGASIYLSGMKSLGSLWSPDIKLKEGHTLIQTGLFKYIRHPMYLGVIIAGFGIVLCLNSLPSLLFMVLVATPYIYLRASVEEDFLSKNLEGYTEYKTKTKMFIPKLF